uniref:Wu:fj64h06 n=1 Tax=Lepisosteus oculatus TaxID=7918 RepID=W5M7S7_LEPOC
MDFIENVGYRKCPLTYVQKRARSYSYLFDDVIYDIPPALLGELLHEELMMQSDRELFQEAATGGAMGYIPFEETDASQQGYLVYPRKAALNHLYFHKVVLEFQEDGGPRLSVRNKPVEFKLNGTIRQISADCVQDQESTHCALILNSGQKGWQRFKDSGKPKLTGIIFRTKLDAHLCKSRILGDSCHWFGKGTAHLTNGKRAVYWLGPALCTFSEPGEELWFVLHRLLGKRVFSPVLFSRSLVTAHDNSARRSSCQSPERHGQTLFRIGETAECKQRERVILPRYLRDVNAYHYLITTQYSAYIMDERFPGLPMIKWEHMMKYPPMFTQVLAGAPWGRSSKVLLGSQCCQELMLLQYSGGSQAACQSLGPPQKLCNPPDCLKHLPIQIPHRQESVAERLRSPGAGLAALYHNQGMESLCVLQLSAAGDIFYQMLRPESDPGSEDVPISTEPGRSPTIPVVASKKVLSRWKRWMAALFDMAERAPRETNSLWVVSTKKLMSSRAFRKHASEDGRYEEVKRELKETMRSRGVLQGSRTHLKALERVPLPEAVAPLDWGDDLSRRLTVAWEGRWNNWWVEKLGLNRDQKIMALRQKRKRQKESRARRRPALPASFTSSVGYQSDLDDRMSWCSATSNFGDVSSRVPRLPPGNKVVAPPDDPDEPDAGSFSTLGSPRPTGSFARSEQEWVPGHGSQNSQPARQTHPCVMPSSQSSVRSSQPKKKRSRMGF